MNKLVVDTEVLEIDNMESILVTKNKKIKIICKGNNKIILEKIDNLNLEVVLLDDSYLDIASIGKNRAGLNNVLIIQNNRTSINYRESFSSNKDNQINIKNVIKGNNNKSVIKVRCISYLEKISIDVLADINKNTKDNELIQDIKGINDGGIVEIKPNMEVSTSEVMANHFVTISKIRDEDLFYLECKGMSKETAKNIILEGFLKSIVMEVIE